MARQVLPIVGAIVGGMIGGPMGASIGMSLGTLAGNAIDPQVLEGPKIGETPMQTSAEGVTRPIVYGTAPVMGNVIAQGNKVIKEVEEEQGKGGPVIVTERLYQTFAVRICEGPIAKIIRIWEDEKLVCDVRPNSPIPAESSEFLGRLRIYVGDESQLPDPNLEVKFGAGNTPAYRGTCYAVFPNADLTDRRGSFPNYRWEVASSAHVQGAIMALGQEDSSSPGVINSDDGLSWDPTVNAVPPDMVHLIGLNGERFLAYGSASAAYTDDRGLTWTNSTEDFLGSGVGQAAAFNDVVIIPSGISGMYRSEDRGSSFSNYSSPMSGHVAVNSDGFGLSVSLYSFNAYVCPDVTAHAWSISGEHMLYLSSGGSACAAGNSFVIGGQYTNLIQVAAVSVTGNGGISFSKTLLPAIESQWIECLASNEDGSLIVAGGQEGEIFYFDGVEWHIADDGLGAGIECRSCIFNQSSNLFIMVGQTTSGGIAVMKTSSNGNNWTTATQPLDYALSSIANLPSNLIIAEGQPIALSQIVSDIHQRCGHTSNKYDVTELTDLVSGIVLASDYTGASAIRAFMPVYFFDGPEYDKKIRYHKRGKAVVKTLTIDDLVDEPEEATRENAIEYPKKINLAYQNPVVGYAPAKATTTRSSPDVRVVGERNVQVPVCMGTDQAAQVSAKLMKVMWAEADGDVKFTVSDKELELVASDCIGLSLRGSVRRLRIDKIEMDPGTMKLTCRNDRQSAYTSNVTGVPVPEPTPPPPSISGATIFAFGDWPSLLDTHDNLNYYVAASGVNPAWFGAMVQRSLNAGASYTDASSFNRSTVMGVLLDDISSASEHYTDNTNVVRVQLYDGASLNSLTQQEFLSEGGGFALEKPDGTFELMQYRDADDEGDDVFALTTILRGRLNTGTSEHLAGSRFVLLSGVHIVPAQSAWLNMDLTHRAVSFNTSPETAVEYTNEYTGKSQLEWPCADLLFSLAGDELTATAVPRYRFGTEDAPIRSINWVGYHFQATDGVSTANREQTSEAAVFNVAGWSTPITVTVWQVNRITGAGQPYTEQYE